jgi:YXWGXW repeat-containing protein
MNKTLYASLWLAATLASGCVIEALPAPPGGVTVSGPPPEPMQETRPPPAHARAVWIPGYWHWTGMQYTWIPGHWEVAPLGTSWRSPRYLLQGGVYYYEPGGWRR